MQKSARFNCNSSRVISVIRLGGSNKAMLDPIQADVRIVEDAVFFFALLETALTIVPEEKMLSIVDADVEVLTRDTGRFIQLDDSGCLILSSGICNFIRGNAYTQLL